MQLSKRLSALKPSPTVALNTKAQQLARSGVKVVNFTVGEPDIPTPQAIVDRCVEALGKGRTKYGQPGGGEDLRKAIVNKLLRDNDLTFAPEQIVVGIGAKEILFHIFMALLDTDDEVLIPAPYWVSYPEQVKAAGGNPIVLQAPLDLAKAPLDIAAIEKAASSKTRVIVLNSPNNPAGYIFSRDFTTQLGEYLKTKNWWIVADEIYEYLAFDRPHESLLHRFPELANRFILVNGLSKAFAMTGWRVGYCAAPIEAAKLVRAMQSHSSTCLPGFIEDAATFALNQGRELMAAGIQSIRERRDLTVGLLSKIPGLAWTNPDGAFYVFMDLRKRLPAGVSSMAFCEKLLSDFHVALVPGEAFGCPGFARLSYTTSADNIRDGVASLERALNS